MALEKDSSPIRNDEGENNNESLNDDHDPHFEPIISLPEVSIKTLEEDEDEMFKGRCKLFRFVNEEDGSEWKERGTGDIKLLKDVDKKTVRVLMRQEKTLKVRANHYITPYMKLQPNCNSDRAFVWYVICDFADEETKGEMFAVKFVNSTQAAEFKKYFEESVAYIATSIAEDCAKIFAACEDEGSSENEEESPEAKDSKPSADGDKEQKTSKKSESAPEKSQSEPKESVSKGSESVQKVEQSLGKLEIQ